MKNTRICSSGLKGLKQNLNCFVCNTVYNAIKKLDRKQTYTQVPFSLSVLRLFRSFDFVTVTVKKPNSQILILTVIFNNDVI